MRAFVGDDGQSLLQLHPPAHCQHYRIKQIYYKRTDRPKSFQNMAGI